MHFSAAEKINDSITNLLFFTVVFGKQINKGLLLFRQRPTFRWCVFLFFFFFSRFTAIADHDLGCRNPIPSRHRYPQKCQATSATTSQNKAETKNTAIHALRFRAGSCCGSSLPDDIASLIQSTPLIVTFQTIGITNRQLGLILKKL